MSAAAAPDPVELLGQIDIYLLDQVMRGRIPPGSRILEAGCGGGRNLGYFLRRGDPVAAADASAAAIAAVRRLAGELAPHLPSEDFRVERLESMSFPASSADVVICSAVLHFAESEAHFRAMLEACWRVLRPSGLFFCRLASRIGMPSESFRRLGAGRYGLPDGSERFLVDESTLLDLTRELGGTLVDPLKTTVVQGLRCMTTWVARRGPAWPSDERDSTQGSRGT